MTYPAGPAAWRCLACREVVFEPDLLRAPNPFNEEETLTGCPSCRRCGVFELVCAVPECVRAATVGSTCWDHRHLLPG